MTASRDGAEVREPTGWSEPPIVWSAAADPRVIEYWSGRWATWTGVDGRGPEAWLAAVHPEDRARCVEARTAALASAAAFEVAIRLRGVEGNYRWFVDRGEPELDAEGRPVRWFGTLVGLGPAAGEAERRRVEVRLRESERWLRRFAESGMLGINFADTNGGIRFANDEFLRIVGYTREAFEAGAIGWKELTPPEWLPADARAIAEARERGFCTPYEKEYVRSDGARAWVLVGFVLLDDDSERSFAFVLDLTARKRSERELRDRLEELTAMMDLLPIPVMVGHDPRCTTITGNRAAQAMFRVPAGGNMSRTPRPSDPLPPYVPHRDGRPARGDELPMQRAAATGAPVSAEEFELRFADGRTIALMCYAAPLFAPDGAVRGCLGAFVDVTDQKRIAEELRQSEERFRLIAESVPHMVWSARGDGYTDYYNQRFLDYLEVPADGMLGRTWVTTMHPDDAAAAEAAWRRTFESDEPYEVEFRLRRGSDQTYRWHLSRALPLRGPDGAIVRWYGTCTDIDERRRAEDAVRESEARFRNMADHAPVKIRVLGPDGGCVYLNRRWREFTGQSQVGGLGRGWLAAVHPDDRAGVEAALLGRADEHHPPLHLEYRLRRHDGVYRWCIDSSAPRFGPDGVFLGYIGSISDIADRRAAEEALREADRRKDEFLSMLAHELRNPLAPISNALAVLGLSAAPDAIRGAREMMERQVRQLVRLVDDLLDVSRIRTGKIRLRIERVDLAAAVRAAVEASEPLIRAAGHALAVEVEDEPLPLRADPARLIQVTSNLLNNAVRYTPPGGAITVRAWREGGRACVAVTDTGIGIAPEMLGRVFEMFMQVDSETAHVSGGLGIGLSLVKTLVELHGGEVSAASRGPGRGSEFVVCLPLADEAADEPQPAPAPGVASGGLRVLVVDDNVDAAESLVLLLELLGHTAWAAHDGPEGLAAIEARRPDVVLLDIGLPGMDGHAVARAARRLAGGEGLFIAALSGWGQAEDRRRSREAGFDTHLVKPVAPGDLELLLAGVSRRRGR